MGVIAQPFDNARAPIGEAFPDVQLPPPYDQVPGFISAAHLIRLEEEHTSVPRQVSFAAFDATVVGGTPRESPYVHRGRAYIQLYNLSSDTAVVDEETGHSTNPDDDEDGVLLSIRVDSVGPDEEPKCQVVSLTTPDPNPTGPIVRLDPTAPPFIPKSVSIRNELDQPITIQEAMKGLRVLGTSDDPSSDIPDVDVAPGEITEPSKHTSRTYNRTHTEINHSSVSNDPAPIQSTPPNVKLVSNVLPMPKNEPEELTVPGSPPILLYPSELEEGEIPEIDFPQFHLWIQEQSGRVKDKTENKPEDGRAQDGGGTREAEILDHPRVLTRVLIRQLAVGMERLPDMKDMDKKDRSIVFLGLAELGLMQVLLDMAKDKANGRRFDLEYWERRIVDALVEQEQRDALKVEGEKTYDCLLARRVSDAEEESQPDTHLKLNIPESVPASGNPPPSPTNWYPDVEVPPYVPTSPPYVPTSPVQEDDTPYIPESPVPSGLDEVRLRVSMLEDRMETTNVEWNQRIKELEAQIFADGCIVGELRWEQAKWRRAGNPARYDQTPRRHRNNRDNKENVPIHRYPTRSNRRNIDTTLEAVDARIAKFEDKIKRVEGKVDTAKREIRDIKEKIGSALAIGSKLEDLVREVDRYRAQQLEINSSLRAEIDVLKQALYSGVDNQIKQQGVDIATLKQAYNQLYTIASNLYSHSNTQFTYSAYPTPAPTPDRTLKPIAAF